MPSSKSIPESFQTLNHFSTPRSTLVREPELHVEQTHDHNDQSARGHGGIDAWTIVRRIDFAEDERTDDATDTARADEGRGDQSAFPLASDIVRLVGHDAGDVGVAGGGGEKDAKVSDGVTLGESEERKTDEAEDGVEDDERTTDAVFVAWGHAS